MASDEVDRLYDQLEKNAPAALSALQKKATHNDAEALTVLGFSYEFGINVLKNVPQAIDYYQRACDAGGQRGCYNAGYFYQYGIGVAQDKSLAEKYYSKIDTTDIDVELMHKLANQFYAAKAEAETDSEIRARLVEYASHFLVSTDKKSLALFNRIGFGQRDVLRIARFWARGDSPDINFYVGHFYNFGFSHLSDQASDIEALKWFRRAAQLGERESQNILGLAYQKGRWGVKINAEQAIQWYERAAQQGDTNAMVNLGEIYYRGELVNVDYGKAFSSFEKAYQNGSEHVSRYLSEMYYNGQFVRVDCDKAWYYLKGKDHTTGGAAKDRFIGACKTDVRLRKNNEQMLPALLLKHESTFLKWVNDVRQCELHFAVNTNRIGEIANLRISIELSNSEGKTMKRTLAFSPFGTNTMNQDLNPYSNNSFRSTALLLMENNDFCQYDDVNFLIKSATAYVQSKEIDLLSTGLLKIKGDEAAQ